MNSTNSQMQFINSNTILTYSRLFDILSSLYLHRPTAEIIEAFNALIAAKGVGVDVEIPPVHETMLELVTDYDELFLVPVSGRYLPPFESAQRAQRLWGPLTHQVANLYQTAGFEPGALDIDDMWQSLNAPDHIGIELAFGSALLQTYADDPAAGIGDLIRAFIQQHLLRWAPNFGERLRQNAQTSLYRSLGRLTAIGVKDLPVSNFQS